MTDQEQRQIDRHNEYVARELAVRDFRASVSLLREADYAKLLNLAHELSQSLGYEMVKPHDQEQPL